MHTGGRSMECERSGRLTGGYYQRNTLEIPSACPACGSLLLSPERYYNPDDKSEWGRPTCTKCEWTGTQFRIEREPAQAADSDRPPPEGECVTLKVPLRRLKLSGD